MRQKENENQANTLFSSVLGILGTIATETQESKELLSSLSESENQRSLDLTKSLTEIVKNSNTTRLSVNKVVRSVGVTNVLLGNIYDYLLNNEINKKPPLLPINVGQPMLVEDLMLDRLTNIEKLLTGFFTLYIWSDYFAVVRSITTRLPPSGLSMAAL